VEFLIKINANSIDMNKYDARVIVAVVLAVAIGSAGIAQSVHADFSRKSVWMNVVNMKTNTAKTLEWEAKGYQFEKDIPVQIDELKERKIKQIFGTKEFKFTWQLQEYETVWYHFKVSIGFKAPLGKPIKISFTQLQGKFLSFESNGNIGSVKIFVNTDKNLYRESERAIIFMGFVDQNDKFVDPDEIITGFKPAPVGSMLEKKRVGSYVYVTPPLERGNTHITVLAKKEGYRIEPTSLEITVVPTWFGGERIG
jgi:hypothetical protein